MALQAVLHGDHRAFGHGVVQRQQFLHLAGGEAVAGDVNHVVGAAHDVDEAFLVDIAAVAGVVVAGEGPQVGLQVARMVVPQGLRATGRQRQGDGDGALLVRSERVALLVQHLHVVAGHRAVGGAETHGMAVQAGAGRGHRPAGLGLPPVVVHRLAGQLLQPVLGAAVELLAGEEQLAQRAQVVLAAQPAVRVFLADRAERGGRAEQGIDLVFLDHPPVAAGVRRAHRLAFVEHRGTAVHQRSVDDQRVADHPADVGNAPPDVAGLHAEDVAQRVVQRHRVAAVVAHDALGFSGGAGGVHDVQRVAAGQLHRIDRLRMGHRLAPVEVAAGLQFGHRLRALQHHDMGRLVLRQFQCLVHQRLVFDDALELQAAGRGEHQLRPGVVDAQRQLVGREAAEHHRVHRADPRAGEHRHRRLRHHRHVDDHPVALLHPQRAQGAGQAGDLVAQLLEGEALLGAGHRGVVDQCGLRTAAQLDLAVEGEVAAVQPAIGEPAVAAIRQRFEGGLRGAVPGHGFGLFGPEAGWVRDGTVVALPVIHYLTL
ncbi:hypothetical protein D9M70_332260 [compost metagenome]